MNPEHKRIVELANGWEDSGAVVSLSPADALLLTSVGAKVVPGKRPADPSAIVGRDLFAAAETIRSTYVETPEGAAPTPNQQSVTGPGTDPGPKGPAVGTGTETGTGTEVLDDDADGLDDMTVPELKEHASSLKVHGYAGLRKDQLVEAIRKARSAK